jgi:ABC-type lipoprotein release transport system permease subunit
VWTWVQRQRYIVDFTLSSLGRRKGKNLALLAVYATIVFALASVVLFTHALRRESALVLRGAPAVVVQRMVAGRHDMVPEAAVGTLAAIRGVTAARGRLWGYYYDPVARANYTLMVPEDPWVGAGQIVVGAGVARVRGLAPPEALPFMTSDGGVVHLKVREVMAAESELVASDVILLVEEDFRRIFGTARNLFTDIALRVRNEQEVPTVAMKVRHLMPDARPITRAEMVRTYEAIFDWRSGLVVVVLSASVLAFVIVAWDKASGLSAEEKREIGVLKAIGWETADVLLMKFWEGAVISFSAFTLGFLLAYVHVFFTPAALLAPVLKGWSGLYPEFRLVPFVSAFQVATLLFLTVVPYTVGTILPSWRAATIDPDAVMRG